MIQSKATIIQWNIQGVRNKKQEILQLLNNMKADIIALQETKIPSRFLHRIPNYTVASKEGTTNRQNHGGVATYIHQDIPFTEINLNTPLQAVATTVHLKTQMTICNIYNSRSHQFSEALLLQLYNQLPKPCLLMGDFNAYSPRWGCSRLDARGKVLESFMDQTNLILLNDGSPTHPNITTDTAIDLTLSSPSISQDFEWSTLHSVLDSDHLPIIMSTEITPPPPTPIKLYKKTNWNLYSTCPVWIGISKVFSSNDEMLDDFYNRINIACNESIPEISRGKFFPKPFWSSELTHSRAQREIFYQRYRRSPTIENKIRWSRARAIHKNLVAKAKEKDWLNYLSEFKDDLPISEICKRFRKLKGLPPKTIPVLCSDATPPQFYSSPAEVSEVIAESFEQVSSNNNYSTDFLTIKTEKERNMPDFGNLNSYYNKPFCMDELEYALRRTKETSPGEDLVTYNMIRHLPQQAKAHLLDIYNKFYKDSFFPHCWKESLIIPILKPGKTPSSPKSYRPIALTSCLSKLFERLLNERLSEYLIMKRVLTTAQSGGQKNRGTLDNLVKLEDVINRTFAAQEHYVSIFFDIERAYDMTWREGIILDMYALGLRGLLPKCIAAFLSERLFKVKVGNTTSSQKSQQNGVPQGSVISVLLFAIKINSISKILPNDDRFSYSLFVDDLQIGYRHPDLNVIKNKLQHSLNQLSSWALKNGFKFSSSKTQLVHFTKIPGLHNQPSLKLKNEELKYSTSAKFLGLTFDQKLTWKIHLNKLKAESQKLLGIMKMLNGKNVGASQQCLMRIYRTYIRSKLDYGCIIYDSASITELKKLDTVAHEALRIASGAFKSTPVESLLVHCEEPSLSERREYLTMRYYLKIKASLQNPAFKCVTRNPTFLRNSNQKAISVRISNIKTKYNLPNFSIKPEFSYSLLNFTIPRYAIRNPPINTELSNHPKVTTSPHVYRALFQQMRSQNYSGYKEIYTDGSKFPNGVGSAAVSMNSNCVATLPKEASIYSAELHAVKMAVDSITRVIRTSEQYTQSVIFTDSKSTVDSLNANNDHPVVRYIIHKIFDATLRGTHIEICWIPCHVDIIGNDKADQKAKAAANRQPELIPIYYKDYFPTLKTAFLKQRNTTWQNLPRQPKLRTIRPDLEPWPPMQYINRRCQVIMNRLRMGHTRFTHGYLMDSNMGPPVPPMCHFCAQDLLSVNHIFTMCAALNTSRIRHFGSMPAWNLSFMLGKYADTQKIINFLMENNLLAEI